MLATPESIAVHPSATVVPDASPQRLRSLARAAQHDILRRLTPSLRHDMVVPLQSLGMMAEALSARMERGQAETDDLQAAVSKLNRLSRQAVARSLEVCTWLDAGDDDTVTLADGVAEVARLLTTSLNFRGFELRTEAGGDFGVSRSAVRFLLAAAILTLADSAPGPGEITVRTETSASHGVAAVEFRLQQEPTFTQVHEQGEAPLAWTEVHALAQQHGVELLRNDAAIVLRLPRAVVTTPLTMVPV